MKHFLLVLSAIIFSQIFHQQQIGLNLIIFETLIFGVLAYHKELIIQTRLSKIIFSSLLLSLFIILFNNSLVSIFIHILNWIVFVGYLNHRALKNISIGLGMGLINTFEGGKTLINSIKYQEKSETNFLKKINLKLYIIPILIVLIFQGLYRLSNEAFDHFMSEIWTKFFDVFSLLNWNFFPLFLLGLFICLPIYYRTKNENFELFDKQNDDKLYRLKKKSKGIFNPIRLKNQYKSALFLFFSLNILIGVLLIFEIYKGWFNFQYTNQNLSFYVHEGTNILIFSILISMGLVLFYFKGNLNFIPKNQALVKQSNIWIILNGVLTFSVAIRCFHYIDNMGLTQKRIGLLTFLIAVTFGLISIFIKVNQVKTSSYLWKKNILTSWLILNTLALFNWDVIIANYNVHYHSKTNIEIFYLTGLSSKTLYILNSPEFKERYQNENELEWNYLSNKTQKFINRWENQHWLSWNYADYSCYSKLNNQ